MKRLERHGESWGFKMTLQDHEETWKFHKDWSSWTLSRLSTSFKSLHVLQVSSWILGGHGGSWQSWKWCLGARATPMKLPWKFHEDQTSWTLSRLPMSFKSLPGVLEDMEVPDKVGNGVRGLGQPIGSFPESFIKIEYLEPCQDSQCPFDPFWSLGGHGGSWQSWKWCQRTRRNPRKLHKKFRQNRTTGSLLNANFCKNYGLWGAVFCP